MQDSPGDALRLRTYSMFSQPYDCVTNADEHRLPVHFATRRSAKSLEVTAFAKSDVSLNEVNSSLVHTLPQQWFDNCITDTGTLRKDDRITVFVYFRPAWASERVVEAVAKTLNQSGLFKTVVLSTT